MDKLGYVSDCTKIICLASLKTYQAQAYISPQEQEPAAWLDIDLEVNIKTVASLPTAHNDLSHSLFSFLHHR